MMARNQSKTEKEQTIVMEGVKILFRNFAGKEGRFNKEGDRNFVVLLDDKIADVLADDGWNIKHLMPRDPEEPLEKQAYLPVSVNFKGRPPRVVMITSRGRTDLNEDTVELLDWADVRNVDLIVRPYDWDVNGKQGRKAYLKSLFITIDEDELELKYADINDVGD